MKIMKNILMVYGKKFAVMRFSDSHRYKEDEEKELRIKIENEFNLHNANNIYFIKETAKYFMENTLSIQNIEKYLHKEEDPF
jgi:hypothetical protein